MQRIEKTVFLSYRRTNAPWALAISQSLTQHGFDVFFDFNGIASGDFAQVIIENIKSRAHFVVLLTPSALDRCNQPSDWLRREIETALEVKRNIVPLTLEGFDFATPKIVSQLTGTLAPLKSYNALSVPVEYFSEAMARLREKYLNLPLDAALHPASASAIRAAKLEQDAASAAPPVPETELAAQELYERGINSSVVDEKLWYFSESIRLRPALSLSDSGGRATSKKNESPNDLDRSLGQLLQARTQMLNQALEDLEHSYDVTLEALGDALDMKEIETEGHSARVTAYTIAIARAFGVPPAEIKVIARAAFLHDIGKMAIPDSILQKTDGFTLTEENIVREHCLRGFEILRKIPFLKDASKIVLHQREHFDGSGFPDGIRGNLIPVGSRIVALAEAFDLITCARPGNTSRTFAEAQGEIARSSGIQFDPAVVDIFLKIPVELWQELRREIEGDERKEEVPISGAPA